MEESKLITFLKTFSKKETKEFRKFVASPFHSTGKNCTPLLRELLKFYPEFNSKNMNYEYLHRKLYPGKKFNKQVMWNLAAHLEKHAKNFLLQISLSGNEIKKKELLIAELGKRGLLNSYLTTLHEMESQLHKSGIDYDFFEISGHLENFKQEYYHLKDDIKPMSASKAKASEYQIMLALRMTVGGLNDMNILRKEYGVKFDRDLPKEFAGNLNLKKIYEYASNNNFEYAFLIGIYYHASGLFLNPEAEEHLDELRLLYEQHIDKLSASEKRSIMHWIINYCAQRAQEGRMKFKKILFDLNKFRLKEGLVYYPAGQIPRAIYLQILNSALSVGETGWAGEFLENYSSKLQPSIRATVSAIGYAYLHFRTREYLKVIDDLKKAKFAGIRDKLNTRILIAQSYYELGETETLLNYIDSSVHFLNHNPQVTDAHRETDISFFTTLKKIVSIRENSDFDSVPQLKKELSSKGVFTDKDWLLKKLDELK